MCGITAYIGNSNAFEIIIKSLALLQNRGYDSIGIATLNTMDNLIVSKYATHSDKTGFDILSQNSQVHASGRIGIGHTRWATHGPKTDINSHPHTDSKNRIAVVHNGIIENYLEIRNKLIENNIQFISDTDTEVIPKLLEYYLDKALNKSQHIDFENDVVRPAIQELQGTWAIVILYTGTPNSLYISKNGSPLVLGMNDSFGIIASEQLPLSAYFTNYISLNDGDIVEIKKSTGKISLTNNKKYNNTIIQNYVKETSCEPFPHWTLKEIFEQGKSVLQTLNMGGRLLNETHVKLGGLDSHIAQLSNIQNIIILGCGTSLHAGQIGATIMRSFKIFKHIECIDASEFTSDYISTDEKTIFLLLSQSGETKDVHRCIELIRKTDNPIVSIVNVVGSLIARESDCGIYLNAGREVGVASTKSFTCQIVALTLFTIWYAQNMNISEYMRKQYIKNIRTLNLEIDSTLHTLQLQIKHIAQHMLKTEHMFILGRGQHQYIADEAALKIKEICYIHAEGYPGGSLKHGPFALIDINTVVILIAPNDSNFTKMIHAAEEIKSRNAKVYLITTATTEIRYNEKLFEDIIYVPENKPFQHILCMLPLQLLAYYISVKKDINPDFPRNLAKVVTVDG